MGRPWRVGALLVSIAGCHADPDTGQLDRSFSYPLDDVLRLNHLQAKGTHNSYHVQTLDVAPWAYTHAPLPEQLSDQGVRQLELDTWWSEAEGAWEVYHVELLDPGTTCGTLVGCLSEVERWSARNPAHHPVLILVEVKTGWDEVEGPARLEQIEASVASVWPEDRLVIPDLLRGEAVDLPTVVEGTGWPVLGELRGRTLVVLHTGGAWRDAYVEGRPAAEGRLMFPDARGDAELAYAAVHAVNDPWDARIPELVDAGHLVRTRCDVDLEQGREGDVSRRDQALASGAHFLSTDFPVAVEWTDYVVQIPGGTPSRCNPRAAPEACTSLAVEDPAFVR